ncbi:MAG: hypothetical protein BZ138_03340 [Methanosphaera sp. rholeuAM270]|nr:MAG: hypothetical protein BZ138_03340 [Methanosphaera sp. rholeuAM270]
MMKKFTPILILILIVGVISVSGCISVVDPDNNITIANSDSGILQNQSSDTQIDNNTDNKNNNTDNNNTDDVNKNESKSKISEDDAKNIMNEKLKDKFSITNIKYTFTNITENNVTIYNISIEESSDNGSSTNIASALMNADTGEIINLTLKNDTNTTKVYSADEAGAYVDIIYKGERVSVRENYPYYSPQNDKIYYSQQEEAEDLYQMALAMKDD